MRGVSEYSGIVGIGPLPVESCRSEVAHDVDVRKTRTYDRIQLKRRSAAISPPALGRAMYQDPFADAEESDRSVPPGREFSYPAADIEDACLRAVRWRKQCIATYGDPPQLVAAITYEVHAILYPDSQGWVSLGWVVDSLAPTRLRIFWHPESNRVQVERLPFRPPLIASEPKPVLVPRCPLFYAITVKVRGDRVTLRARLSIGGPEGVSAPTLTVPVPLPEDKAERYWFISMMRFAESGIHYAEMPPEFPSWTGLERRDFVIAYAHGLAARKSKPRR